MTSPTSPETLARDRATLLAWKREQANPLRRELGAAALRVDGRQMEILRGLGLPAAHLLQEEMIGVVRGTIGPREFWQPDEAGAPLLITPSEEGGRIIDLIAFDPREPDAWACRTGHGWALGHDAINAAVRGWETKERLELHATPIDWLAAGGSGACVWRWCDDARAALREIEVIDVGSLDFQRWLRTELLRLPRLPDIQLRRLRRHAA